MHARTLRTGARAAIRLCACLTVFAFVLAPPAHASGKAPQATSSRQARNEAERAIPLDKLDSDCRDKVASVLEHTSIYRRLAVQVTDCDPDLYLFMARHPEVAVNMWRVMGVTKVDLRRVNESTFEADDHSGTTGTVKYCYRTPETHVIYGEGQYEGPVFERPIRARCVLLLKSNYLRETNGRYLVSSRMDTFISIDQVGVELVAKTLQPLITRTADYNFRETLAFVGDVSHQAEVNRRRLLKLNDRLTKVDPPIRDKFAEICTSVAGKAAERGAAVPKDRPSPLPESPPSATAKMGKSSHGDSDAAASSAESTSKPAAGDKPSAARTLRR